MRVMAVDVGTVRVGVAVSDPTLTLAVPKRPLDVGDGSDLAHRIAELANALGADTVVVGLPLAMDGSLSKRAAAVRRLAIDLRDVFSGTVVMWDERLTTVEAERMLKEAGRTGKARRGLLDSAAASVLLQSYLDSLRREGDGRNGG